MGLLKLAINRQTRSLVAYGGSVINLPDLFQSNLQTLQVSVVDPTGLNLNPYSLVDLNGYGLRASIGDTPTGSAGGPTPLALQDTFVWDPVSKSFSADLALNVAGIDAFLGAAASKQAYLELNLTLAGNRETLLQNQFTLRAVVDELSSIAPTPTDQFLTKAECLALFARLIGTAGMRIVLVSPDGTKGRELGVNNDGSALDNLITL